MIGKGAPRLVTDLRGAWIERQRSVPPHGRWDENLVVKVPGAKSFILLGDPGEQDTSQYVVVPVLRAQSAAEFMVIVSDVIYPAGDVNDYVDGFYIPYQDLELPIYGLPGNHDWYDGLNGFMWHFCGAEALVRTDYLGTSYSVRERLARRLWRRASAPRRDLLTAYRSARAPAGQPWRPRQPGPYYAIETDDLMLVCVDSGITGEIDREQAEWLVRVSRSYDKPKILLTGKPLLDKMEHRPGCFSPVEGMPLKVGDNEFRTVDDVVRHQPFRYVAAIGGDTHNYQRYDVVLDTGVEGAERPLPYIVSGGGGAYMSATHTIPEDLKLNFKKEQGAAAKEMTLESFACYPTRSDSLRYFSRQVVPTLWPIVVGVVCAVLGVGLAVLLALVLDIGRHPLEDVLFAGAGLLAFPLLRFVYGATGVQSHAFAYATAFVLGAVIGLLGWRLSPDRFGTNVGAAAAVAGAIALITLLLRRTRWWRHRAVNIAFLVIEVAGPVVVLFLWPVTSAGHKVVVAIVAVLAAPVAVWGVDWLFERVGARVYTKLRGVSRSHAQAFTRGVSPAVVLALTIAATYAIVRLFVTEGRVTGHGVFTALATLVVPVGAVLAVDAARRFSPHGHRALLFAVSVVIVLLVWLLLGDTWVPRAAATAVEIVSATILIALIGHLNFFNAFSLLYRADMRTGTLDEEAANEVLAWRRDPRRRPSSYRTRRIANMVYPGSDSPAGPLHRFVSEIFDRDDPPLYKNFLRAEVEGETLTVTCIHATGEEEGPDDVRCEEPVTISLTRGSQPSPT